MSMVSCVTLFVFIVTLTCIGAGEEGTTTSSTPISEQQEATQKQLILKGDCLVVCDASASMERNNFYGGGSGSSANAVAFSVQKTSQTSETGKITSDNGRQIITFDSVLVNLGFYFDTSKNVFKVPRDGVYSIQFQVYRIYNSKILKVGLTVDGSPVLYGVADGQKSSHESAGNSGIIKLHKGQEVKIEVFEGNTLGGWRWSTFSGHMLYDL